MNEILTKVNNDVDNLLWEYQFVDFIAFLRFIKQGFDPYENSGQILAHRIGCQVIPQTFHNGYEEAIKEIKKEAETIDPGFLQFLNYLKETKQDIEVRYGLNRRFYQLSGSGFFYIARIPNWSDFQKILINYLEKVYKEFCSTQSVPFKKYITLVNRAFEEFTLAGKPKAFKRNAACFANSRRMRETRRSDYPKIYYMWKNLLSMIKANELKNDQVAKFWISEYPLCKQSYSFKKKYNLIIGLDKWGANYFPVCAIKYRDGKIQNTYVFGSTVRTMNGSRFDEHKMVNQKMIDRGCQAYIAIRGAVPDDQIFDLVNVKSKYFKNHQEELDYINTQTSMSNNQRYVKIKGTSRARRKFDQALKNANFVLPPCKNFLDHNYKILNNDWTNKETIKRLETLTKVAKFYKTLTDEINGINLEENQTEFNLGYTADVIERTLKELQKSLEINN